MWSSRFRLMVLLMCLLGLLIVAGPTSALASGDTDDDTAEEPWVDGDDEEGDDTAIYTPDDGGEGDTQRSTVWRCIGKTDYPHNSGHGRGRVNVEGRVTCNVQMDKLKIKVQLQQQRCRWLVFCSWYNVGDPGNRTRWQVKEVETNSNTPCVNGKYRGRSWHWLTWPDGTKSYGYSMGKSKKIRC